MGGKALTPDQYREVSARATAALEQLPAASGGYLSPTGAYTIAGVSCLARSGVDSLVVEEGLGGASDEVSLLSPVGVAVTPIFEEHVGVLGETRVEIAEDLLGVVRGGVTEAIWTAAQTAEVAAVLEAAAERCGAAVIRAAEVGWAAESTRHVAGLGAANAALGAAAGAWLAERAGSVLDPRERRAGAGEGRASGAAVGARCDADTPGHVGRRCGDQSGGCRAGARVGSRASCRSLRW